MTDCSVGSLVYDKADARKRIGIIIEEYCGRCLVYFDDQTKYWLYHKEFQLVKTNHVK